MNDVFDALVAGRDGDVLGLVVETRDFSAVVRGSTLLGLACELGRWELVRPLLALGADPNGAEGQTRPPLHWAVAGGNALSVRALLDNGAAIHATDSEGRTALSIATAQNNAKVIAILLGRGAMQRASMN